MLEKREEVYYNLSEKFEMAEKREEVHYSLFHSIITDMDCEKEKAEIEIVYLCVAIFFAWFFLFFCRGPRLYS